MDAESFYTLATKYLSGEATLPDTEALGRYLEEEYYLDLFLKINEKWILEGRNADEHQYNLERGMNLLQQGLGNSHQKNPIPLYKKYIKQFYVAAAIITIPFTGLIFYAQKTNKAIQQITITAAAGKIESFRLPDGSNITLNAGSKLTYPEKFKDPSRDVYLKGEALFKVKSDKVHPFIVHTGGYSTKAVGTVFNIKAFADEDHISIALIEGKVLVSNQERTLQDFILLPMQILNAERETGKISIAGFNPEVVTSWRAHKLYFKEDPFPEVMHSIERKFGISISYNRSNFKDCKVTASFGNESIVEVFEALKFALRFDYQIVQKGGSTTHIIIKGSGC